MSRFRELLCPAVARNAFASLVIVVLVSACYKNQNQAPLLNGLPGNTKLQVGQPFDVLPIASDGDGDTLTFEITNKPGWMTFNPDNGELKGTPTDGDVGSYNGIQISVSDGKTLVQGNAFNVVVEAPPAAAPPAPPPAAPPPSNPPPTNPPPPAPPPANQPPTLSGSPATEVVAGQAYSFTPTASDPDGDKLTFSIANQPPWASFDSSTGTLSGTPGAGSVGTYANIVITVSDGQAQASLAAFTITVQQVATGSATLSWSAPTQRTDGTPLTDLAGYKIHFGTTSGSYPNQVVINNAGITTYVVENLSPGTYYFSISSFDATGAESRYSNPASTTIH